MHDDEDIKPALQHGLPSSWAGDRREPLVTELRRGNRRPRRRTRGFVLVPIIALVAAGGAGAVALFHDDPPAVYNVATCYASARPGSAGVEARSNVGGGVVESCRREWRAGRVGSTRTPPALVACLQGDAASVVPGRDPAVCRRLGLDPLPEDVARRSLDFDRRMKAALKGCLPVPAALRLTRRELDRVGRDAWQVRIRRGQGKVARRDCVDSYGTVEVGRRPGRVELDYPTPGLTDAQARQFIERSVQEGCARKGDPVDEAFRAAECDLPRGRRKDPRRYAAAVERQLARRGIHLSVRPQSTAPGKIVTGFWRSGDTMIITTATRRELATPRLPRHRRP